MNSPTQQIIAGFIPLLDSAVLVAAAHRGFAEAEGIALNLVRETSWANIRDRVSVGHFDVAHMLAPMPIASSLNLTSLSVPMVAPMVLGLGGNAITVSNALAEAMKSEGWTGIIDPQASGLSLAHWIKKRTSQGLEPLRFAVVHPFSGHAYELRYWLAAAGIVPDQDVEITVLPPSFMADALKAGRIDGYCVGEPWNMASIQAGIGQMVTCKQAIWPNSPEKVLGLTERWGHAHEEKLYALLRALSHAAEWCSNPANAEDLAKLLSHPDFLDCSEEICLPALGGRIGGAEKQPAISNFLSFVTGSKAAPREDHGLWFYSQMVRWGQVSFNEGDLGKVSKIFDDGCYHDALGLAGKRGKAFGAPFALFDGVQFQPNQISGYIDQLNSNI